MYNKLINQSNIPSNKPRQQQEFNQSREGSASGHGMRTNETNQSSLQAKSPLQEVAGRNEEFTLKQELTSKNQVSGENSQLQVKQQQLNQSSGLPQQAFYQPQQSLNMAQEGNTPICVAQHPGSQKKQGLSGGQLSYSLNQTQAKSTLNQEIGGLSSPVGKKEVAIPGQGIKTSSKQKIASQSPLFSNNYDNTPQKSGQNIGMQSGERQAMANNVDNESQKKYRRISDKSQDHQRFFKNLVEAPASQMHQHQSQKSAGGVGIQQNGVSAGISASGSLTSAHQVPTSIQNYQRGIGVNVPSETLNQRSSAPSSQNNQKPKSEAASSSLNQKRNQVPMTMMNATTGQIKADSIPLPNSGQINNRRISQNPVETSDQTIEQRKQ